MELASKEIIKSKNKNTILFVNGSAIANHYVCDYLKFLRQYTNLNPKL